MDEHLAEAVELLTAAQKHLSDESELFHRIMFFLDTVDATGDDGAPNLVSRRLKTKQLCVLTKDKQHTRTFITPLIEIDDKFVYIRDENTESKVVECETRKEARQIAQKYIDESLSRKRDTEGKRSE